jgi:hypothetical protein
MYTPFLKVILVSLLLVHFICPEISQAQVSDSQGIFKADCFSYFFPNASNKVDKASWKSFTLNGTLSHKKIFDSSFRDAAVYGTDLILKPTPPSLTFTASGKSYTFFPGLSGFFVPRNKPNRFDVCNAQATLMQEQKGTGVTFTTQYNSARTSSQYWDAKINKLVCSGLVATEGRPFTISSESAILPDGSQVGLNCSVTLTVPKKIELITLQ